MNQEDKDSGSENFFTDLPASENQPPAGFEPMVEIPRVDHEALLKRLDELESLKDKLMRGAADYENAKKRLMREREEFVQFSRESILCSLLPVLDNLERALAHAGGDTSGGVKNLMTGIQLVMKQLNEVFKSNGLVRLETVGKIFDPHLHESIGFVKEAGRDHEIVAEIEAGYKLGEKLLRAAKVRVRISESGDAGEA